MVANRLDYSRFDHLGESSDEESRSPTSPSAEGHAGAQRGQDHCCLGLFVMVFGAGWRVRVEVTRHKNADPKSHEKPMGERVCGRKGALGCP